MRLLARLITPRQEANCSNCGRLLLERRRKPCPTCGDTRRTINRTANESLEALDRTN